MEQQQGLAEQVIRRYSAMVYRLAYAQAGTKSDADDIYQEVFMRYIRKQPAFESEEHCKAWLIRVTVNCAKKLRAAAWRAGRCGPQEFPAQPPEYSRLREELLRLPARYRAVIHLFYYEDMSIENISRTLGQKPSTIRVWLTRARRKLKEFMKEEPDV